MASAHAPVTVLIPGDLHLTKPGLPNHRAAIQAVTDANDLIHPDFVQFIGDNVDDGTNEQFALFHDVADRLQAPWFALAGDHDVKDDPQASLFLNHVGDGYGSISLRGFRFVRLNTQEARPLGLSPDQINWFRSDVDAALLAGERVVVFQHNYPYQIWEDFAGPGIDAWREVVQTRRIHAILCGHTHYWQVANDGRNVAVAMRSIGSPEGGPPGYAVAVFHGDDFAIAYRSVQDRGPFVLITHPRDALLAVEPAHVVEGSDEVRALVWSASPLGEVDCRIDDGPWMPMQSSEADVWHAALPAERLAKGVHRLAVRAENSSGESSERGTEFAVDPTGRFTAVPMTRPLVTATNFC